MTLVERILADARKLNAFDEEAVWTLRAMFEAMLQEVFHDNQDLEIEDVQALQARYGERLAIATVVDILHDSDECCSVEFLLLDGAPVLQYSRVGDKLSYADGLTTLKGAVAVELLGVLATARIERRMQEHADVAVPLSEEQLFQGVDYLTPLGDGLFVVDSPRAAIGFRNAFASHKAFTILADGQVVKVLGLKHWLHRDRFPSVGEAGHQGVFDTERGELTLDAREVIFSLCAEPDAAALDALAKDMLAPSCWTLTQFREANGRWRAAATVSQHLQGKLLAKRGLLVFTDGADASRTFKALEGMHSGVLNSERAVVQGLEIDWYASSVAFA